MQTQRVGLSDEFLSVQELSAESYAKYLLNLHQIYIEKELEPYVRLQEYGLQKMKENGPVENLPPKTWIMIILEMPKATRNFLYVRNCIFNENYWHGLKWINEFIHMFSMDISKVMDLSDKEIEYIPTQVIAEYIRSKGYDGIKFESSVNNGSYNYALFCRPNKDISSEHYLPSFFDIRYI